MSNTLGAVKESFLNGSISESEALSYYKDWVKTPTYIVLTEADHDRRYIEYVSGSWPAVKPPRYWVNYYFVKASKRGNDVYRRKVSKRFYPFYDKCKSLNNVKFLNPKTDRMSTSHLLFFTLTYDPSLCNKQSAWSNIGRQLNTFLSNIKKRYGKIKTIRCFEAFHKNGYPHIHLIIEFLDHTFNVSRYRFKSGKIGYILTSKSENESIGDIWHSYIKCEAVRNTGGVGYILKYVTKDMYVSDDYTTISHLWLYHKQSYSVSKGFLDYTVSFYGCSTQLDTIMPNSNLNDRQLTYLCSFNAPFEISESFFVVKDPPEVEKGSIWSDKSFEDVFSLYFNGFYENKIDDLEAFFNG